MLGTTIKRNVKNISTFSVHIFKIVLSAIWKLHARVSFSMTPKLQESVGPDKKVIFEGLV